MPPADFLKPISQKQIDLITRWISQGAEWKDHWAWTTPERPEPPEVEQATVENDIDRFVISRLKNHNLAPSKRADKVTLIRRLSFDLTGLPPTWEQVQAFLDNKNPAAYNQLVAEILQQPQFGERMAMYWLDVVRYADSNGYHADKPRQVAPYRDYVIRAFNTNKPYDVFVREQLAGDLIPDATNEEQIASAFNMLLQTTDEGGAQAKEYLAKYAADRVRNTASVFMGVTFGCAQCHDHKYDPFTTREFYQFAAFFSDISEVGVGNAPAYPAIGAKLQQEITRANEQLAKNQQALIQQADTLVEERAQWELELRELARQSVSSSSWQYLGPLSMENFDTAHDESVFDETQMIDLETKVRDIGWKTRTDLVDGKIHALNTQVNSAQYLFRTLTAPKATKLLLRLGSDDGIRVWVNGVEKLNKKITRGVAVDQEKVEVNLLPGENTLLLKISQGGGGCGFYFNFDQSAVTADVAGAILAEADTRSDQQKQLLADHFRSTYSGLKPARDLIANTEKQLEQLSTSIPKTLMTKATTPRMTRILPRGNWLDESGAEVQPAVPGFLPPLPPDDRRFNRLDLANWMTEPVNPLTARVFVNRLWKLFFGYGISRPLDDIGSQSSPPTHPQLLDWLAVEFIDSGWDVKHLVSLIVRSSTYQQSSNASRSLIQRDPYNHWLARQTQFRLDAEMVRDNALAVSGLLALDIGGESVKPYQPPGYWKHMNFPKRTWMASAGNDIYRRGLYTHWQRMFLHPSLLAFDAPSREECTVERPRSNTPQQALVLLNDPTYVEAARVFALQILKRGGANPDAQLQWAFQTALSRSVTDREADILLEIYAKHRLHYQTDPAAAKLLLAVGREPIPADVDTAQLAAWTSVARILFNLHESITRN